VDAEDGPDFEWDWENESELARHRIRPEEEAAMIVPDWERMSEAEVAAYYREHKDDAEL
jgi:hypothetical protein